MKEQFITFEIALKLKELGFDEPCFGYYTPMKEWMMEGTRLNPERHFHGCNWANSDNSMYFMYKQNSFGDRDSVVKNSEFTKAIHNVAVPLWQQAIDWFRENHQLNIEITDWSGSGFFKFEIFDTNNWNKINLTPIVWAESNEYHKKMRTSSINTYQEAREQAILKAIELCQKEK